MESMDYFRGVHKSMESPCGLLEMLNVALLKSMESPQSPHGVLMESVETYGGV